MYLKSVFDWQHIVITLIFSQASLYFKHLSLDKCEKPILASDHSVFLALQLLFRCVLLPFTVLNHSLFSCFYSAVNSFFVTNSYTKWKSREKSRKVSEVGFLKCVVVVWHIVCMCGCLTEWDRFLNSFQLSGTQTVLKLITHSAAHTTAQGGRTTFCFQHTVLEVCVYLTCVLCYGDGFYACLCLCMCRRNFFFSFLNVLSIVTVPLK